jgi:succinoglycan biosynthesis transport protein ExoP
MGALVDFSVILQALRNGWWMILAAVLAASAFAGLITISATPMYASTTRLFVSTTGTDESGTAYQGNLFSQQRVASYVQLLTGTELAGRVIDELGMDEGKGQMAGSISAVTIPNTVLLDVTVTRASPVEARDVAVAVAEQFSVTVGELETPEGAENSTMKVTVVEPPEVNTNPVSPQPTTNLAVAIAMGLIVGIGIALVAAQLDKTIKSPADASEVAGAGLVGVLTDDPAVVDMHVHDDPDSYSSTAEAYRQMRTNLQFLDVDNPPRVIVVSSSLPGEGKTTVAVNLAVVLAQSGSRVALLEGDLRRPRVTRYLKMISGAGLSNVLSGSARFDELSQPYRDGRLTVLAAGPVPMYPSEMLGSQQMGHLLDELRAKFDYVIIDAPPLLPVTDAAVLSKLADGAIVVARHGVTTRQQLTQAAADLHRIEARLLGVVLNRMPVRVADGYGYSYSYEAATTVPGDAETGVIPVQTRRAGGKARRELAERA